MSAANLDILVEQGATFSRTLTLRDSSGNPIDVTGWTFQGQVRTSQSDSSVLAEFVFALADQTTYPGQVSWSLSATTTRGLAVPTVTNYKRVSAKYIYDVNVIKSDSTVERILQGTCELSPEATRE